MPYRQILTDAVLALSALKGRDVDVVDIARPPDLEYALHLAKVISKLSPLIGNMLEYRSVIELNQCAWPVEGKWHRQDPGFPDTVFLGDISPIPGIEIKTWFPLATEMTARFKESVTHFNQENTLVAVVAWLPSHVIFGKPRIIDVWAGPARSLADARDSHYHNPPDYLVFEPQDTTARTSNLQQTNTGGFKFQGDARQRAEAEAIVETWGERGKVYNPAPEYQQLLKMLQGRFPYREDTNYSKIDRIEHGGIETFKTQVLCSTYREKTISQWAKLMDGKSTDLMVALRALI